MKYIWVFLGDIKGSRNMNNREEVQKKLIGMFESLNKKYEEQLTAGISITRGDEFGCASKNPTILNKIGDELWLKTYGIVVKRGNKKEPLLFRYAIAKGEITTSAGRSVGAMDGPVFQYLDEKMKELKKKNMWVSLEGFSKVEDITLTSFKNLIYSQLSNLSLSERKIVSIFYEIRHQSKVAKKAGVKQPYISKVLKKTNWQIIEKSLEDFNMILEKNITKIGYKR